MQDPLPSSVLVSPLAASWPHPPGPEVLSSQQVIRGTSTVHGTRPGGLPGSLRYMVRVGKTAQHSVPRCSSRGMELFSMAHGGTADVVSVFISLRETPTARYFTYPPALTAISPMCVLVCACKAA